MYFILFWAIMGFLSLANVIVRFDSQKTFDKILFYIYCGLTAFSFTVSFVSLFYK